MKHLPNILIVGDVEDNLVLLKFIVSCIEVNRIQALSGEEALKKTYVIQMSLASIDVKMPEMNGIELALKANEIRPGDNVPIIFLTAMISDELEEFKGNSSEGLDNLYKPVRKNPCSMLTEQFKHLRINLTLSLDTHIPPIIGNTYKLEQVIINLLVNVKDVLIEKEEKQFESKISIKTWLQDRFLIIEITNIWSWY